MQDRAFYSYCLNLSFCLLPDISMNWQKMAIDNGCNILQWNVDQNERDMLWRVYYLVCLPNLYKTMVLYQLKKNEANSLTHHKDI